MKIAFLFSGQGAQYSGMMEDLYNSETKAKEVFDIADKTLNRFVSKTCFAGTQDELNMTHNTQPCVLAADLAAGMTLMDHGIAPSAVAGFSLGEYAAMVVAGAIPMDEVFKMVQIRADAMQDAVAPGDGAMAAMIGVDSDKVEEICSKVETGYVVAANYNSPVQTVISGEANAVDEAINIAETQGVRCIKLAVSAPFHCKLMEPAALKLKELFQEKAFSDVNIPVYANYDGVAIKNGKDVPDLLVKQAMNPVRWVQTLQNMQEDGIDTFIECGPGKTLSGLVKKTLKDVKVYRVENEKTLHDTDRKSVV